MAVSDERNRLDCKKRNFLKDVFMGIIPGAGETFIVRSDKFSLAAGMSFNSFQSTKASSYKTACNLTWMRKSIVPATKAGDYVRISLYSTTVLRRNWKLHPLVADQKWPQKPCLLPIIRFGNFYLLKNRKNVECQLLIGRVEMTLNLCWECVCI